MLRPGPGTPAEEVAQNQRERLFGAMVASVSEAGYSATRVTDLVELSGVSKRSFYDLFPDRQACFQAMIEEMLSGGIRLAFAAESKGASWEERAVNRFQAFAMLVAEQPAAARMCLIEAHAAGPEALKPIEEAIAALEETTAERFAESPERAGTPPEMIAAFVGATLEIARTRLNHGRQDELPARIPELMELLLTYRPPPQPLRLATRPAAPEPEAIGAHDHSERAVRAFAVVASERGYADTRISQVVKRASMSPTTFYAIFDGKEDVLMAGIESAGAQVAAAVLPAFRRSTDWAQGIRAAFEALFSFLASRPALAQLVIVETYAAGPAALKRREEALRPLETILAEGRARRPEVTRLALEAIAGGIVTLAYQQIRRSGAESLPSLAPICTYLTLAPFIGAGPACEAANGDGRTKGAKAPDMSHRQMLSQTVTLLTERPASIDDISRQIDAPVERVFRILEELKAADLVEVTEEGGVADADGVRYRTSPVLLDDEHWAQLSLAERQEISTGIAHVITAEIDRALDAGSFDARVDRYLTHAPVWVDEQGWRELMEIHDTAFKESRAVQEASAKRLERSGKPGIDGRSVQVLFEMPEQ